MSSLKLGQYIVIQVLVDGIVRWQVGRIVENSLGGFYVVPGYTAQNENDAVGLARTLNQHSGFPAN